MLIIPTTNQAARGVFLGVLLFAAMVDLLSNKKWRLNFEVAFIGAICLIFSMFFMLIGALHDNPVLMVGTVYVLWPFLFLFFMGLFQHPEDWYPFLKVLIIGGISAATIGIIVLFEGIGFLDFGLKTLLGEGANAGISNTGVSRFSIPNLATVLYALPFLLALIILPKDITNLNGAWRKVVLLGLLLTIIALILAGRRAFWVSSALSPFIILIFSYICNIEIKLKKLFLIMFLLLLAGVVAILFFDINMEAVWDNFIIGFNFSDVNNEDAFARKLQFDALLHGWIESPLIGDGHGGGASEYIRVPEMPYDYELSYMALLFHTGLIGIFIYGGAVIWLFLKTFSVIRRRPEAAGMLIPLLTGLTCFLIANTSNPYLEKFDYLWTLFLPIAVLNAFLLNRSSRENFQYE
jgi:drug/metabolite transporter (DMT)-like permease